MKRLTMALAVMLPLALLAANDVSGQPAKPRRKSIAELGGIVTMAPTGRVIRIENKQTRTAASVLEATASVMSDALNLPVVVVSADEKKTLESAAVIVVEDRGDSPRLLVAPEEGWAAVNTEALAKDGTTGEKYDLRVTREMWRAFAIMLGASDSMFQPCLLAPVHSIADLDSLKCNVPSPEPFSKMQKNARALGCTPARRATYLGACREGWAPAPTNDIQKAIWDEVHKLPTEPIKIEPEAKKVKE